MKKSLYVAGLITMVLSAEACSTKDDSIYTEINKKTDFEVFANQSTKTVTSGAMSIVWEAGDEINLFHAENGTSDYINDGNFTITAANLAVGKFTGTLGANLDETKQYDWFAFYPYSSSLTTPANTSVYSLTVGPKSQTQSGNDNQAAISAQRTPMYGKTTCATNVKPSFNMRHLTSLMKVNITNHEEAEIIVSSITFETASQIISGGYYVDFTNAAPIYTPKGAAGTYKFVTLTVNAGTAINKNSSSSFYFVVKPFIAPAGEKLTVTIVLSDGSTCTKTTTLASETIFSAGAINNLNVSFVKDVISDFSGTYITAALSTNYYLMSNETKGTVAVPMRGSVDSGNTTISDYSKSFTDFGAVDTKCVWVISKIAGTETYTIKTQTGQYIKTVTAANIADLTEDSEAAEKVTITYDSAKKTYQIGSTSQPTRVLSMQKTQHTFAFFVSGNKFVNSDIVLIPYTLE